MVTTRASVVYSIALYDSLSISVSNNPPTSHLSPKKFRKKDSYKIFGTKRSDQLNMKLFKPNQPNPKWQYFLNPFNWNQVLVHPPLKKSWHVSLKPNFFARRNKCSNEHSWHAIFVIVMSHTKSVLDPSGPASLVVRFFGQTKVGFLGFHNLIPLDKTSTIFFIGDSGSFVGSREIV